MVKNPPANAGDTGDSGSSPGLGKSPGGGKGHSMFAWKSHGQRSLVGYRPSGHKELNPIKRRSMHKSHHHKQQVGTHLGTGVEPQAISTEQDAVGPKILQAVKTHTFTKPLPQTVPASPAPTTCSPTTALEGWGGAWETKAGGSHPTVASGRFLQPHTGPR